MPEALNTERARLDVALARHEALRGKQRRDCDPYPFLDDDDLDWTQRMRLVAEAALLADDRPRD